MVVESMTNANRALREAIEKSADEVSQLEKFEDHFRSTRERFSQFKRTVLSNNRQADELLVRLEQSLIEKRRNADDLRRQIAVLKHEKKEQDEENQRLDKALDENVDHLKSISITNGSSVSNNYVSRAWTN